MTQRQLARGTRASTGVLAAAILVAAAASLIARLGTKGVYVTIFPIGGVAGTRAVWDLLGPRLAEAARRISPGPGADTPLRPVRSSVGVMAAAVVAGIIAYGLAGTGKKGLYGIAALSLLAVVVWLLWPTILLLFNSPAEGTRAAPSLTTMDRHVVGSASDRPSTISSRPARGGSAARHLAVGVMGVLLTVVAAGVFAYEGASAGKKGLLALGGSLVIVGCLLRARNKTLLLTFGLACSMTFLVHKSFGPQDLLDSSGAISVYVTSFDVFLLMLYVAWMAEGTFAADVRAALRRRILWVPLLGAVLLLPSLVATGANDRLSVAELVRMVWMYLLFFYVSVRVRTRAMVWAILAGLGAFAVLEIIVVLLQWKTGGVLGLSFLGVPTQLTQRTTDTSELGRPFGTLVHPVFMGAAMGSLGLVAFSLGLALRRSIAKIAALLLAAGCVFCLYLAHTRAALLAFVVVLLAAAAVAKARRWIQWKTIGRFVLVLLLAAAIFFPQLDKKFHENFGTGHFSEEVTSRLQLNTVGGHIFTDHPVIGAGLNNFQHIEGPYETHGIIFRNNPVHNLYLLYLAETGVVGFCGLLIVGVANLLMAFRLARARDRLLGAIGLGAAAAMSFLIIEEMLGFSLRQDQPLIIYWILAGLSVAGCRMAGLDIPTLVRSTGPNWATAGQESFLRGSIPKTSGMPAGGVWRGAVADRLRLVRGATRRGRLASVALLNAAVSSLRRICVRGLRAWRRLRHAGQFSVRRQGYRTRIGALRQAPIRLLQVGGVIVLLLPVISVSDRSVSAQGPAAVPISEMRIVFAGRNEHGPAGGPVADGIFVVNGDGSGLKALLESPTFTTIYDWPVWAMGGTKIVYTVRNGPPVSSTDPLGQYENIWMMNADGTDQQQLTHYNFRALQPKVSPDGRRVLFTASNPQSPLLALYTLDLLTLQATNLSQLTQPNGSLDSDPRWISNDSILFSSSEPGTNGEILTEINADGTNRQVVVNDGNFNTDAEMSPDGTEIADAAFQGSDPVLPGATFNIANPDDTPLNPLNWYITVRNLTTGAVTHLSQGQLCGSLTINCAPGQSSGFQPLWSPDGTTVAWLGRLNAVTTCICAANADGSGQRVLIPSTALTIRWFDWTQSGGQSPATAVPDSLIGSEAPTSQLLVSLTGARPQVAVEPPDMMGLEDMSTGTASDPMGASWAQDRSAFVFVADVPFQRQHPQYGPPPPLGQSVHEHFTFQQLEPALQQTYPVDSTPGEQQVFLHEPNADNIQLTTPWTEDWRDALDSGDYRSNTDPVLSPNRQYVVFTNHSSLTGESFLLRMDLRTGAVLNLTNGTAGALQVDDALPAWSPDSSRIAFTTSVGSATDIYVMNASDGKEVTEITDDHTFDMTPAWSPDGSSIVYSHYDGILAATPRELESLAGLPRSGWSLVEVTLATGKQGVLTRPSDSPTWRPVFSPDGKHIDFIGWKYRTVDIFQTTPTGAPVQPLLITPLANETSVDWR